MKKPVVALLAVAVAMSLAACGGGSGSSAPGSSSSAGSLPPASSSAAASGSASSSAPGSASSSAPGVIESGSYTLPSGLSLHFSDSVRNDATGKWRISTTADSLVPADYALEYYEALFSSDDEVHAIWNATLGTTTSITADPSLGCLFVDTHEYVDGEEHDAKLLFSGAVLDSRVISIETGEPLDLG